jgi:hypothetical protein
MTNETFFTTLRREAEKHGLAVTKLSDVRGWVVMQQDEHFKRPDFSGRPRAYVHAPGTLPRFSAERYGFKDAERQGERVGVRHIRQFVKRLAVEFLGDTLS